MSTIFKKIIDKKIPAQIVYEDDHCLAFKDIDGKAPTHLLLIPKIEISSLNDLNSSHKELLGHMMLKVPEIAQTQGIAESGYRIVCNCGKNGGQSVYHLHIHILGGRSMEWPPG
jgi:histidine triad (HIT) family protein